MNNILKIINNKIIKMKEKKLDYIFLTKEELEGVKEDEIATKLISVLGVKIEVEVTLEDELKTILEDYDNDILSLQGNACKERAIKSIIQAIGKYAKR